MPKTTVYFNTRNRQYTLCRLLHKLLAQGWSVAIITDSEAASQVLDRLLWEVPPTAFLPHCAADHPHATFTPIWLDHRGTLLVDKPILINWCVQIPSGYERFERLLEIVSLDDADDKQAARQRVQAYRAAACELDFVALSS